MDRPSFLRQKLAIFLKTGISVPELGDKLQWVLAYLHHCDWIARVAVHVIPQAIGQARLTTKPPKVSVQQLSTLEGSAAAEQDRMGSTAAEELAVSLGPHVEHCIATGSNWRTKSTGVIVRGDARVKPSGRELGGGGQREEDGVAEHGEGLVRSCNCLACLAQSGLAMRYDRSYGGVCA